MGKSKSMKTISLTLAIACTIMAFRIGTTADVTVIDMTFVKFCAMCFGAAYMFITNREE